MENQPRVFSGIKPSGELHIGNYLGAIKQWVRLQAHHACAVCVVDEHAITVPQDPTELRRRTLEIASMLLAFGIDPERSILFVQSHVPAHTELGWILTTLTPVGDLQRMTQYKDALVRGKPAFAGLLNYPVLMAADILLYRTDLVPVGEDQIQHVELARSIAERFNRRYGKTFVLPQALVENGSARVMALDDPTRKMSKSEETSRGYILLTDPPDRIRENIRTAVTDSGHEIRYDPKTKPAIANLLTVFSEFSGKAVSELEHDYAGKRYVEFKNDLAEAVVQGLAPFQARFSELRENPGQVLRILKDGAKRAAAVANATLGKVKRAMGFLA